jgi:hypothetical protein
MPASPARTNSERTRGVIPTVRAFSSADGGICSCPCSAEGKPANAASLSLPWLAHRAMYDCREIQIRSVSLSVIPTARVRSGSPRTGLRSRGDLGPRSRPHREWGKRAEGSAVAFGAVSELPHPHLTTVMAGTSSSASPAPSSPCVRPAQFSALRSNRLRGSL